MIIKTPKYTRNYLLLKKGGLRLFNSFTKYNNNSSNFKNKKMTISINNTSKERPYINTDIEKIKKINKKDKNFLNTFTTNSQNKFNISKYVPNLKEYKKHLFLKNILMSEKNYLLEDYIKNKEISLLKNRNIKTMNDVRKTFFTDDKINDNRTSYFYKECLFDDKDKFPLMIKDINSNFILWKNQRYKKYKDYLLLKKFESEKNYFKDFNDKLGIRNIYIKSNKLFSKSKTFMNNNLNFFRCSN